MRIPTAFHTLVRSRRARIAAIAVFAAGAAVVAALTVLHFVREGWPFAGANGPLVAVAGVLFLLAFAVKGAGWRRMFANADRPDSHQLAAANAAASVTGVALPGRFDDVVRVAVARRFRPRTGIGALCLSIVAVGFVDAAAIAPFAAVAACFESPAGLRIGLALLAGAGIGAALVVVAMPRLGRASWLVRFRVVRWLVKHATSTREAVKAWFLVSVSWSLRAGALYVMLLALGVSNSFVLALLFLCASAASAALPVGPGGAATQAGAGAGALALVGVPVPEAIAFAVAAQALLVFAAAAAVVAAAAWETRLRLVARTA